MTQWLEHWFLAEDLGLIPSTRTLAQTLTPMLGDLIPPSLVTSGVRQCTRYTEICRQNYIHEIQ